MQNMRKILPILMAASLAGCANIETQDKSDVMQANAGRKTALNREKAPVSSVSEPIATQIEVDVVKIHADGTYSLNGRQIPVSSLSGAFKKDVVQIMLPSSAQHSMLIAVLEETKEAGITQVSVRSYNEEK
jgi:biopolymer transport protein ExbD